MNKNETSWGSVADWYSDHLNTTEDSYHKKVVLPNLLRMMAIKPGEKILDLACGTGFFSAEFVKLGAEVSGVDISPELIAIAKKNVPERAQFIVSGADNLSGVQDKSVDKIACVLAIQNILEVKKMLQECNRVLKDSGKMYVVMNHPAYRIPRGSSWGWDEENKKQYRRIDQYLSEMKVNIDMEPGSKRSDRKQTVSYHRPLQFYSKVCNENNFAISKIEEWISHKESEPGKRQHEENRIRQEIPLFMCLELISSLSLDKVGV